MTHTKPKTTHPTELELADYLDNRLEAQKRSEIEEHLAVCAECLDTVVTAHEAVSDTGEKPAKKKGSKNFMKKINIYLMLAILSFALSFSVSQYFVQFLVATLLFGIKWIVDAKTTKMLVMIYDAWKTGGDKETSRILKTLNPESKKRF